MESILEKLKEFKESFTERIRSPFIGNFMITWSLLHWKIYLLIFFAEEKLSIKNRIDSIEAYLTAETYCSLILKPVLITLLILLCYAILNGLGLSIKLIYDNWISTLIQKWLNNENIIQKNIHTKLQRHYNLVKKELDEYKKESIDIENECRELKTGLEQTQQNWFEGRIYPDITAFMSTDISWHNTHQYSNGTIGNEYFTTQRNHFILANGEKIEIDNIKASSDGKILFFNKIINDRFIPNSLIKDKEGNYIGIENNDTLIAYRKKSNISIIYAKYGSKDSFIDITEKVKQLIHNNNTEIYASNEIYGDPAQGRQKKLEINYKLNGFDKTIIIDEWQTKNLAPAIFVQS